MDKGGEPGLFYPCGNLPMFGSDLRVTFQILTPSHRERFSGTMRKALIGLSVLAISSVSTAWAVDYRDAVVIKEGKRTFNIYCSECHSPGGVGGMGPNLTDQFTLHGADYEDMVAVITKGVAAVGMPKWGARMTEERIRTVAAYVFSLYATRRKAAEATGEHQLTQE
jgi:mono/diheme cytochrome c family protein